MVKHQDFSSKILFRVLTDTQVTQIKETAFNILEQTGVEINHKEALDLLTEAGARIDGIRAYIPRSLIDKCIASAPKGFTIYDRNGQSAMEVKGRNIYYGTSTASPYTRDPFTGEVRETRVSDIALAAKISDALPNIDYVMPMGSAQDVPPLAADLHEFVATVKNTSKPIVFTNYSSQGLSGIYKMAAKIAGGMKELQDRPFLISYPEPVSPLTFPEDSIKRMFIAAELNLPQIPGPSVQPGATAPVTMAGAVAQLIAEILMGVILIQLKNPGAPCFLGGNYNVFDMKTTLMSIAAPEMSLGLAAQAEVAQSLGLPSWGLAGSTDSKVLDAQAGIESVYSILTQGLAGLNLIHDVGYMDMAMICSLEMLVLGDEAIGMAKRFMQGIEVSPETLAEHVINKVGPGGDFLEEKHTLKHFRKELWFPSLMTRKHYSKWKEEGSRDITHRIKDKINTILKTHQSDPLPESIVNAIEHLKIEGERKIVGSEY